MFELWVRDSGYGREELCNEELEYVVTLADFASKYVSKQCRLSKRCSFGGILGKFVNMFRLGVFRICVWKKEMEVVRGGGGLTHTIDIGALYLSSV